MQKKEDTAEGRTWPDGIRNKAEDFERAAFWNIWETKEEEPVEGEMHARTYLMPM